MYLVIAIGFSEILVCYWCKFDSIWKFPEKNLCYQYIFL